MARNKIQKRLAIERILHGLFSIQSLEPALNTGAELDDLS